MRRAIRITIFLLAISCAWSGLSWASLGIQQESSPLACTSCDGKGELMLACELCEGDGKGPCQECAPRPLLGFGAMWRSIWRRLDPESSKKIDENRAELTEMLSALRSAMGTAAPGAIIDSGLLKCPAIGCVDGESFLNRKLPCKVCKAKGTLKCGHCKGKGESKCAACLGKRKRLSPCKECRGTGYGHDPLLRTADAAQDCPWCFGDDLVDCSPCDGKGLLSQHCVRCAGSEEVNCSVCAGTSRMPCNKCSGTGDLSSYLAFKKSNKCDKCETKGFLPCTSCKKGRQPCLAGGRDAAEDVAHAHGELACRTCYGTKFAPCRGCWEGTGHAWKITGDRLLEAKHYASAAAHYERAFERDKEHHKAQVAVFAGTDKDRKRLERILKFEQKALQRKLIAAQKKAN